MYRTASLWRGLTKRKTLMSLLAVGLGAAAFGITKRQMSGRTRLKHMFNWKFWR